MEMERSMTQNITEPQKEAEIQGEFKRNLGLFDATSIVAGCMIGCGIFIVTSETARLLDSAWLVLLVWGIVAITTTIAGLCYSEYAAAIPEAGGMYVYLKKVFGKRIGFLYGWTLFLVVQTGCIAAISVAFAKFTGVLLPHLINDTPLLSFGVLNITPISLLAMALIVLLTYVNSQGVKLGALVQNIFTSTKLIALFGLILVGIFLRNPDVISHNFGAFPSVELDGDFLLILAVATVGAFFAADSWHNVTFIASEIKNPEKNLPKALAFGMGGVCIIYFITNLIYLSVLELSQVQNAPNDIVVASFFEVIFGPIGKMIMAVLIMISAVGSVNGTVLAGARAFWAMAKDGLFFNSLSKIDSNSGVPVNALVAQGLWSIILVLSGSFTALLVYITFIELVFYVLTIGGLFQFRHKYPNLHRPYKTLWYPVLPIIYCIFAIFMAVALLIHRPENTLPGLVILFTGLPVYYLKRKYTTIKGATN